MYCDKCGNKYIDFEGECTACKFSIIRAAFSDFGAALNKVLQPAIDAITVAFQSIPDKKQIARQHSRDDLKSKRGSLRRGGYDYRR